MKLQYCCWISDSRKVISFHSVEGFNMKEFTSYELLLQYVHQIMSNQRYRIQ